MKKLILKESQIRRVIDLIISEQVSDVSNSIGKPTPQDGESESTESWDLCGYDIIKKGDGYYFETGKGELLKLPLASQLSGTIQDGEIVFSDEIENGIEIGQFMKKYGCRNTYPMQYAGASTNGYGGSWFVFIDDLSKQFKEPTPLYSIFTWNGSLKVGGESFEMKTIKEKDGSQVIHRKTRTKNYYLELSPALAGRKNSYTVQQPTPTKQPEYEEIKLDIQSPFEFDKVTLTPEAETQFKSFIEKIKANYQGVTGNVEVICSASIDGDENLKRDYNQKLSENRAVTIANRLKTETGITTLNFIPKGIGQTDQFAKGMKYPEVKDTNKTAPNRRLIIKMPTLKREKK